MIYEIACRRLSAELACASEECSDHRNRELLAVLAGVLRSFADFLEADKPASADEPVSVHELV